MRGCILTKELLIAQPLYRNSVHLESIGSKTHVCNYLLMEQIVFDHAFVKRKTLVYCDRCICEVAFVGEWCLIKHDHISMARGKPHSTATMSVSISLSTLVISGVTLRPTSPAFAQSPSTLRLTFLIQVALSDLNSGNPSGAKVSPSGPNQLWLRSVWQ